jgi:hypothetical protein
MAQALPVANAHDRRERAPRRVTAAMAAWGWRIEGQAVNVCWPVGNRQFRGTSCEGDFFRQLLDFVGRGRRLDVELRVQLF